LNEVSKTILGRNIILYAANAYTFSIPFASNLSTTMKKISGKKLAVIVISLQLITIILIVLA